jgi:hypothetical protein
MLRHHFNIEPMFRKNVSPLYAGSNISRVKNQRVEDGYSPPKRQITYGLQGAISQKMGT